MKKCFISVLMLFAISTSFFTINTSAADVVINGSNAILNEEVLILNNQAYVPMRDLFTNIGAEVLWNSDTHTATAVYDNTSIDFKIDSNVIAKNGESFWLGNQCKLIDGKTYIPVRAILELLGFKVSWNEESQDIEISTPSTGLPDNSENPTDVVKPEETGNNEYEEQVLELINHEREKFGLNKLVMNSELSAVAKLHSKDMYNRQFFSHTNPDGHSPFDRIKNSGISYKYAAENIAVGQSSPEDVVTSWMNSQGHRENILNPKFKKIGIGYFYSDKGYIHYWTQCFTD